MLEVGTGSGAIAHYFAGLDGGRHEVHAVDVADQRQVHEGYRFTTYDGRHLPFADDAFDIVISNHVIEHVGRREEQAMHLGEIRRVLAPRGHAYLAAPSRWQMIEPHFHLPFLSWLPRSWSHAYVRLTGKGENYDCNPLTHAQLERLLDEARLRHSNLNVSALQVALELEPSASRFAALVARTPNALLQALYRFSPTMVYMLDAKDVDPEPHPATDP